VVARTSLLLLYTTVRVFTPPSPWSRPLTSGCENETCQEYPRQHGRGLYIARLGKGTLYAVSGLKLPAAAWLLISIGYVVRPATRLNGERSEPF
jgi:hypothetical protein